MGAENPTSSAENGGIAVETSPNGSVRSCSLFLTIVISHYQVSRQLQQSIRSLLPAFFRFAMIFIQSDVDAT